MPTADRVLPWRRSSQAVPNDVRELVRLYRVKYPRADASLLTRAYNTAAEAHDGQVRRSGDPYIVHPLAVATILAELGLDDITLAAALLHDAVEDTVISLEDVTRDFGPEVAAMVDGVTKLDRVRFDSKEAQQAATMRKMLVAMAKDIRVLLIKLADRLHNMRTIAALPERSRSASPRRRSTSTPRWPTACASVRSNGSWKIWPSPRCIPSATPRSSRWCRAERPSATSTCPRWSTWCGPGWWR